MSLLFVLLLGLQGFAQDATPVIKVGSELDFYPYAFVNKDGKPDGFSVDLIQSVAKTAGLKIEIAAEPWDKVWNDLVAGRIDLLPLVGKLPERAMVIEFSEPHTGTADAFFVRTGEPPLTNLAAAKGKTIVVMRSDVAHHKLLEYKFDGTIVTVPTISEGLQLIASGQHDAFLGPLLMGTLAMKDQNIKGLDVPEPVADYMRIQAFAVKKGDFALLAKLNDGLKTIKSNGEYTRIYNKWLVVQKPAERLLNNSLYILTGVGILLLAGVALLVRRMLATKTAA